MDLCSRGADRLWCIGLLRIQGVKVLERRAEIQGWALMLGAGGAQGVLEFIPLARIRFPDAGGGGCGFPKQRNPNIDPKVL